MRMKIANCAGNLCNMLGEREIKSSGQGGRCIDVIDVADRIHKARLQMERRKVMKEKKINFCSETEKSYIGRYFTGELQYYITSS